MTRRPVLGYVVAGILLYLFFLLVSVPAAWLERALAGAAMGLRDTTGTIWRGNGTLVMLSGSAQTRAMAVRWQTQPWWLFAGRLQLEFKAEAPDVHAAGKIAIRYGSTALRDVTAHASATVVEQFYAPAALAKPRGMVYLQAPALNFSHMQAEGKLTLRWENAGIALLGTKPAGDFQAEILAEGETARIAITTLRGDLSINASGTLRLAAPASISLKGTASGAPDRGEIAVMLGALGKPDANGRYAFQFHVPLRL